MDKFRIAHILADAGTSEIGFGGAWEHVISIGEGTGSNALARNATGKCHRIIKPVADLNGSDIPAADLLYANAPGASYSVANHSKREGEKKTGALHHLGRLVREKSYAGEGPSLVVVETVTGLLGKQGETEFSSFAQLLAAAGYQLGCLELQAMPFVPQSRSRLFVVGVRAGLDLTEFRAEGQEEQSHDMAGAELSSTLLGTAASSFVRFKLPTPPAQGLTLTEIIDRNVEEFDSPQLTHKYLGMMTDKNREKLEQIFANDPEAVGAFCQRTRVEPSGKIQRIEARFDCAGCIRTAGGGSSRQKIFLMKDGRLRSRLFSRRELCGLMGLPADFLDGFTYTQACQIAGQGSVPPVLDFLSTRLLLPILENNRANAVRESPAKQRTFIVDSPSISPSEDIVQMVTSEA